MVRISPAIIMILPLLFGTKPAAVEEFEKLLVAYNAAYDKEWLDYCDMPASSDYSCDYASPEWDKMMMYAYNVLYFPMHKENVLYKDLYDKVASVFASTGKTYGGRCYVTVSLLEGLIRDATWKLEHGTAVYREDNEEKKEEKKEE